MVIEFQSHLFDLPIAQRHQYADIPALEYEACPNKLWLQELEQIDRDSSELRHAHQRMFPRLPHGLLPWLSTPLWADRLLHPTFRDLGIRNDGANPMGW